MFDFVRDIIAESDSWGIKCIISEMESLICQAKERLEEINNEEEDNDEWWGNIMNRRIKKKIKKRYGLKNYKRYKLLEYCLKEYRKTINKILFKDY